VPQGARDVRSFYAGSTLQQRMQILRHYNPDFVLVHANSPPERQLQHLPGFTDLNAPGKRYSLLAVDAERLPSP
ncbi:MAG TPA: hypothetical protein VHM69_05395, partial [Rubrobacter sp.]|nr:hypothetical protein [Rubrobacter sp.]